MRTTFFALILVVAVIHPRLAGAETIDFEAIPGMTPVNGFLNFTPVPPEARLGTQLLLSDGVLFRSEATFDFVALIQAGVGHATSGSNTIGGVQPNGVGDPDIRYAIPTLISFFVPGSPGTKAVTDLVSIRADLFDDNGPLLLEAFDAVGTLIGTDTEFDIGGPTLSVQAPGIHSIRLVDVGGTVGWDDLTFNSLQPAQLVPEPCGLELVVPCLLTCLGMGLRRRRSIH